MFFYDKLMLVIIMGKRTRKIVGWAMFIIMVGSVIATLVGYALSAK